MRCVAPVKVYSVYGDFLLVPCGGCITCEKQKRKAHVGKLIAELMHEKYSTTQAVTLTLSEYGLDQVQDDPVLFRAEVEAYRHRLKMLAQRAEPKRKFKIDIMIERGEEKGRLHAHCILMGQGYPVPNDTRFHHESWSLGLIHAMDITVGNMHYHCGHQSKKYVKPLWRSQTQLGNGLLDLRAKQYAERMCSKPITPAWVLAVGGNAPARYPWTPHMLRRFRATVQKAGWHYPQSPLSDRLLRSKLLDADPDYWKELEAIELDALIHHDKILELARIRKVKNRAL